MLIPLFAQVESGELASDPLPLLDTARNLATQQGFHFAQGLFTALVILILGRWAAKILVNVIVRLLVRANVDETLRTFLRSLTYILLMALVIIAALSALGVDTTSMAAAAAAAGLAIGLALQNSLGNFASGVMLLFFRPFQKGDYIEAGGTAGIVEGIQIFSTMLRTPDNVQIIVPNGTITAGTISNFSANDTRRIDLVIGCGYNDDIKSVKQYLEALVASDERILKDPAAVVAVGELSDSSVNFVVRPWVKSVDYWNTRWDLIERIKVDFDEKGFTIPYPTRQIHVHNAA